MSTRNVALQVGTRLTQDAKSTLIFVGLTLEARIAITSGGEVLCHDRRRDSLDLIREAVQAGCRSIISFGLAGALAPDLRAGDWIVASSIVGNGQIQMTDSVWSSRLLMAVPHARYAPIFGGNSVVVHAAARNDLYVGTGAVAIDRESHSVAKAAATHSLRFAALRVVVDAAHRRVPPAALDCICGDGNVSLRILLQRLLIRPADAVDVLRLATDWLAAKSSLVVASNHLVYNDDGSAKH